MSYDLVIFDLDGTLLDSLRDLTESLNHALGQCGLHPVSYEQTKIWVGKGLALFLEKALGDRYSDALFEEIKNKFLEHYAKNYFHHTHLYDGIQQLLATLDSSYKMAVCSNKHTQFIAPVLDYFQIKDYFPIFLGGDNPYGRKPEPEGIYKIIEYHNSRPEKTILVGDMQVDVLTAQSSGTASCAVLWGYGSEQELRTLKPDYVISSPGELIKILSNHSS
jgi:2-phosphoglycolate phosphatase